MRVGIDMDGVLSNFTKAYAALLTAETGLTFPLDDPGFPSTWYWDRQFGVTKEQEDSVWTRIKADTVFWATLDALPGADDFLGKLDNSDHEVYFITDRPGIGTQVQTQYWLGQHGYWGPNVIISRKGKGVVCDALSLEVYIDDKPGNIEDCILKSPATRTFMLSYPYNKGTNVGPDMTVTDLQEFWRKAGL